MHYAPPPISVQKYEAIVKWATDVEGARQSSPSRQLPSPTNDFGESLCGFDDSTFHGVDGDCDMDVDRRTFVFEGDQRLLSLPHPSRNPLVTTDLDMLLAEYVTVLELWNKFLLEKHSAQRMLRGAPTPDNIERVYKADAYIEAASIATRYIETHAIESGHQYNFNSLFFKVHQIPGTGLYPADDGSIQWEDEDSLFVVQPHRQPPPIQHRPQLAPASIQHRPQPAPLGQHMPQLSPVNAFPQAFPIPRVSQHSRMSSLTSVGMPFNACPPMALPTWSYYVPPTQSRMVQV